MGIRMYNGTPHPIHIVDRESVKLRTDIRKYVSEEPVVLKTIEPMGILNAQFEEEESPSIDGIPVKKKVASAVDPIPEGYDVIIASALYAGASKDARVYTVSDPVYTPDGKTVIGCLGIGKTVL